jgi:hypothetical protein
MYVSASQEAQAWLDGEADLLIAGAGRQVPVPVQLGVLAHADLDRLVGLGRHCRRGSVRRAWGTEMARLAGDLARWAGTPERLRRLQRHVLIPLEVEALAGRLRVSCRQDAVYIIRRQLALIPRS